MSNALSTRISFDATALAADHFDCFVIAECEANGPSEKLNSFDKNADMQICVVRWTTENARPNVGFYVARSWWKVSGAVYAIQLNPLRANKTQKTTRLPRYPAEQRFGLCLCRVGRVGAVSDQRLGISLLASLATDWEPAGSQQATLQAATIHIRCAATKVGRLAL